MARLQRIEIDHIGVVERPANRRRWLLLKSQKGEGDMDSLTFVEASALEKALNLPAAGEEEILKAAGLPAWQEHSLRALLRLGAQTGLGADRLRELLAAAGAGFPKPAAPAVVKGEGNPGEELGALVRAKLERSDPLARATGDQLAAAYLEVARERPDLLEPPEGYTRQANRGRQTAGIAPGSEADLLMDAAAVGSARALDSVKKRGRAGEVSDADAAALWRSALELVEKAGANSDLDAIAAEIAKHPEICEAIVAPWRRGK